MHFELRLSRILFEATAKCFFVLKLNQTTEQNPKYLHHIRNNRFAPADNRTIAQAQRQGHWARTLANGNIAIVQRIGGGQTDLRNALRMVLQSSRERSGQTFGIRVFTSCDDRVRCIFVRSRFWGSTHAQSPTQRVHAVFDTKLTEFVGADSLRTARQQDDGEQHQCACVGGGFLHLFA